MVCVACRPKGWKPPGKDEDSDSELEELTEAELAELERKEKEIEIEERRQNTNLFDLATNNNGEDDIKEELRQLEQKTKSAGAPVKVVGVLGDKAAATPKAKVPKPSKAEAPPSPSDGSSDG